MMQTILSFIFTTTAKAALALLGILGLTGCSSVFYYPSRESFVNREKLPNPPEDIYFPSKNGKILHGWYFKSSQTKTHGVIVHFHGNAQNLSSHFAFLLDAPQNGFDHFIFDYQGYGLSQGQPNPKNLMEDGAAALKHVQSLRPGLPLIVFGQSLGGNIALRVVSDMNLGKIPAVPVKAVVVDSTFGSYRSAARQALRQNAITWPFQPIAWLIVDNSGSVDGQVKSITPIPLLVIHGTQDHIVPYVLGEQVFKRASEPKEFWTIEGGTHTDFLGRPEWHDRFYQKLRQYAAR